MQLKKKTFIFFLALFIIPFINASIYDNQTEIIEDTSNSYIRFEQDTTVQEVISSPILQRIVIDTLTTFSANFTNINSTFNASVEFINLTNVTVLFENGTLLTYSGNNDFNLTIYTDESILINQTVSDNPPVLTNIINHTQVVNLTFSYDINATDDNGLDTFTINDTSVFTINATNGTLTNSTPLINVTLYWLNVTVNDTAGQPTSAVFFINITTAPVFEDKILQMWRNFGTGSNVSTIDNQGNWIIKGNVTISKTTVLEKFNTTYTGGSAYLCIFDNGTIFTSEVACP